MEDEARRSHRGRLDQVVQAMVGLVGDHQLSCLLQRTVAAACTVVDAASGSLEEAAAPVSDAAGPAASTAASILRVPLMVHGAEFVHIHLVGHPGAAAFTAEDEELVKAVLSVAGASIERTTVQREHRRERWMVLLNEIAASLMAGSHSDDVLALAARGARELAVADLVAACIQEPTSGRLDVRAADGYGAEVVAGSFHGPEGAASYEVITTGETLFVEDSAAQGERCQPLVDANVLGPALFVPLSMEGRRVGTLAVGRSAGRPVFSDVDRWLVESFASQVSLALEYGLARVEVKRVAVAADQERIARDLHDTVIQQLFAIGMSLQAVAKTIPDPAGADRVHQAVDALDLTIRDIRGTVFELQNPPGQSDGLRAEVFALAAELCPPYELAYHVRFQGPIDTAVTDDIAGHVLATLREAISNAGRHARASRVEIDLDVGTEVELRVKDNGIGMAAKTGRHSGLRNLQKRAGALGGVMEVTSNPTDGTLLVWRVPL